MSDDCRRHIRVQEVLSVPNCGFTFECELLHGLIDEREAICSRNRIQPLIYLLRGDGGISHAVLASFQVTSYSLLVGRIGVDF